MNRKSLEKLPFYKHRANVKVVWSALSPQARLSGVGPVPGASRAPSADHVHLPEFWRQR